MNVLEGSLITRPIPDEYRSAEQRKKLPEQNIMILQNKHAERLSHPTDSIKDALIRVWEESVRK